jgi:thiosulfate/3-mercaptopyruvate sulfurtransferase
VADKNKGFPHMMPNAEEFIKYMKSLRIRRTDNIVCYDNVGIYSAPRAAYMLRFFGADRVRVLNGGLKKWLLEDRKVRGGKIN